MVDEIFTKYYKDTIMKDIVIKKSIFKETDGEDTIERSNIFKLCFMGLLREGYPYKTVEHEKVVEIERSNKSKKKKDALLNAPDVIKEKFLVMEIDGDYYECKMSELKEMFQDDFMDIINSHKSAKDFDDDFEDENNDNNIVMAKLTFAEDEDEPIEKPEKKTSKKRTYNVAVPVIENDHEYPDDEVAKKSYLSFYFDTYNVTLNSSETKPKKYKAYIYPLKMDTTDTISCPILTIISNESMTRVRSKISDLKDEKSNGVEIEIDDTKFMARGKWKNGVFMSSISLISSELEGASIKTSVQHIEPTKRTSSFYQRVFDADGNCLNIFPLGLSANNPETGIAPVIGLMESSDGKLLVTPKSDGTITLFFDGSTKNILPCWIGDDLTCQIEDNTANSVTYS